MPVRGSGPAGRFVGDGDQARGAVGGRAVAIPARVTDRRAVAGGEHPDAGDVEQHAGRSLGQQRGEALGGVLDLLVKGREQGPVGGEHAQRRGPFGARQPQGLLRGLDDPLGFGSGQAYAAATHEAQHAFYSEPAHSVGVGQVADQHAQRGGVEAVGEAAGQPREDQVELCVDLVGPT